MSDDERRLISERPTTSIEAYDLFVRGREILRRGDYGQDKFIEAEPLFQRAVELDPEFVLAWTRLAEIHGQAVWLSIGNRESRTAAMKRAIARAVELAPEQPEVLAIQGEYHYRIEHDYERAAGYFERAHARLPGNPDIASQMGMIYRRLGRWDEAVARFEQAAELDPASLSWTVNLADTLFLMRQWDRAIAVVDPLLREYPDASALAAIKGWALLSGFGRIDAARDALAGRPLSTDFRFVSLTLNLPLYARDFSAAEAVLDWPKLKPLFDAPSVAPYREVVLAMIRSHQGLPERSRDHLRRARQWAVELVEAGSFGYDAWATLALIQAQLGESDQALVSIDRALAALAATGDQLAEPEVRITRVEVPARAGQVERALDELDRLIGMPGGPSRWDLALNPQWDFLREHPRFAEMTRAEASLGQD